MNFFLNLPNVLSTINKVIKVIIITCFIFIRFYIYILFYDYFVIIIVSRKFAVGL